MGKPEKPVDRSYKKELQTLSREQVRNAQLQGIRSMLERVYNKSLFYRERLQKAGVRPDDINSLEDYSNRVPLLTKEEVVREQAENPPFGRLLCVPENKIRQLHITSGSSGLGQEVHALSKEDLRLSADSFLYHTYAAGLVPGDVDALLWPVATMAGGLIASIGLQHGGLNGMLLHVFDSKTKLERMRRFNIHHFWATPAYLTRLTALCEEMGIVPTRDFPRLKSITVSTEPFPVDWALRIEETWGCTLHDMYGSTQLGIAYATTCGKGVAPGGRRGSYHLLEHMALVEVLDPETGKPVKHGEEGEPVVTTFLRRGMPLLRFKSNDRVRVLPPEYCDCGRTGDIWEAGTISRYDDMVKMKATNVWPQAVDEVVFAYPEIDEYNGRVLLDEAGKEQVVVIVEFRKTVSDPALKDNILRRLPEELKRKTGVSMDVKETPFGTIERFEYKVRRWTDEREKGLQRVKFLEKG